MAHWLIYALGGGAGHAVRGARLGAALSQLGVRSTLLVADHALAWAQGVAPRVVGLAAPDPGAPAEARRLALRRAVEGALDESQAEVLVVDTFPGGILGELGPLPEVKRSVFMSRLRSTDRAFYASCAGFDLVVDLEPNLGWFRERALGLGPVVRRLEPALAEVDVAIVVSEPSQRAALSRLGGRLGALRTVYITPSSGLRSSYSARLVIGPCGYNLCYELAAAGIWHVAIPAKRAYDDQRLRAAQLGLSVSSPEALERRVWALLSGGERPPTLTFDHQHLARALIAQL